LSRRDVPAHYRIAMSTSPSGSPSKKPRSPRQQAQLAAIQSQGGKTVTAKKIAHLSSIAAKGGSQKTPKKAAHLASIAAKGGRTVTEKKREHLRKALAARWAKARGEISS
jgi:hypothetical protein